MHIFKKYSEVDILPFVNNNSDKGGVTGGLASRPVELGVGAT